MAAPRWVFLLNWEMLSSWVDDPTLAERFRGFPSNKGPRLSTIPFAAVHLVKLRAYARSDLADGAPTLRLFSLRALLNGYRSTSATHPRDKVFAMLSMADRTKMLFSDPNTAGALARWPRTTGCLPWRSTRGSRLSWFGLMGTSRSCSTGS